MRKLLAILLAVLMVVPAFAFTASAEEATPAQKLNIIPILTEYDMPDADMDTAATVAWKNVNGGIWGSDCGLVYDAGQKGFAKTWTGTVTPTAGYIKFTYSYFRTVDISGIYENGGICFDLYLSDPDALGVDTVEYDFELRSYGGNDSNEWNAAQGKTLTELYGGDLQKGWNHFELPLSLFHLVDKPEPEGTTEITPDPTQIYYFRFYNASSKTDIGTEGESAIMMKNIYFVDQCAYKAPEAQIVDIWDGSSNRSAAGDEIYAHGNNRKYPVGLLDVDGDGTTEFAAVHAVQSETTLGAYGLITKGGGWDKGGNGLDAGWGISSSWRVETNQFDASENAAGVRFEIFISDTMIDPDGTYDTLGNAAAYDTKLIDSSEVWTFEITSARGSDYQEICWVGNLKDIFGHQLVPNTWVPVVLMFDKATDATPGDASKYPELVGDFVNNGANYIRLYNGDSEFFTFTGDMTIAMRNFQSIRKVEEQTTESRTSVYGIEDDNGNCKNRKWFVPTTYADTMPSYANAGEASNQAVISEHFKTGVQDASGGKWGTRTGEMKGFKPIDTTGMDTICFDLFINYYGTASLETMLANTWDSVTMDKATKAMETPFQMEISSGGARDVNEHEANVSLAMLTGLAKEDIKSVDDVNGWHHVEIPLSEFKLSTDSKYRPGGAAYGNGEKYETNWAAINYFSLWLNGPYTAAEGVNLMLAVDNLYFKDSAYVAPEVETPKAEIDLFATPSVDNSFNLSYEVTTNEQVISNPIVNVTFGGKTTSESDVFAFDGILAHRLSDTITTTVLAMDADHKLVRKVYDYSIKKYAENKLADASSSDELKRMLSDALYYGAAAQTLIGYNTENLASDLEGILKKVALDTGKLADCKIKNVIVGAAATEGPAFKSAALVLDSELAIRIAFTGTPDSLTIGDKTYDSDKFVAADGYYYVDFPVSANHFDVEYKAYFGNDASYCLNYSVNHYLATKYKAGDQLADLLAAIYNYGTSADAYATVTGQND